jgi:hypothetical protein
MWTQVSYNARSQLASECRDKRGKDYPPTRAASWLRRALTNVATSILRHEEPVGFGVTNVDTSILRHEDPVDFGGP